jgi:hypothetical protein
VASYPLPKALLAGIIVVSVFGLFKYRDMKTLFGDICTAQRPIIYIALQLEFVLPSA